MITRIEQASNALQSALGEAVRLRKILKKSKSRQVTSSDELQLVRSTALSWFNSHSKLVQGQTGEDPMLEVSSLYRDLIAGATKATLRTRYDAILKSLVRSLSDLQTTVVSTPTEISEGPTADSPPDFSALVPDPIIRSILVERWNECRKCVAVDAALAGTVMMGALLETLLLARINRVQDKTPIFSCASAPKNKQTGKSLPLQDWGLRNYIDVSHEMGWITQSAKDVGEVLRDYRNYVHPYKQITHGLTLGNQDSALFWEISKSMARQVIASVP